MYYNNCHSEDLGLYVKFTGPCVVTGALHSVIVSRTNVEKYEKGALLQDAFTDLNAGDREFLKTGISPRGWEKLFGGGEES